MPQAIEKILPEAVVAARRAGRAIMQARAGSFKTRIKKDNFPVTDADVTANDSIHTALARYGWPILSEESADDTKRLTSEYVWIVDPLDGTKSFIDGGEDFCVMIGLVKESAPVLAVVYQPATDKLYTAVRGSGVFMTADGTRAKLKVSKIADPAKARFIGSRHHGSSRSDELVRELGITRVVRMGSNGIKMGLIAEGRFDLMYNPTDKMGEWDVCAPQLILEEAGGRVTGSLGEKLVYNKLKPSNPYGLLATNGAIHGQVLANVRTSGGLVVWLTGLSGSGKTTIAQALKTELEADGKRVCIIDGDEMREKHKNKLGFSREHIRENNHRIAQLALEQSMSNDLVLVSVIAPYREDRAANHALIGKNYIEVFIDCPLSVCEERDMKGLYKKARAGEITNFISISDASPYERPTHPDVVIDTGTTNVARGVEMLKEYLVTRS